MLKEDNTKRYLGTPSECPGSMRIFHIRRTSTNFETFAPFSIKPATNTSHVRGKIMFRKKMCFRQTIFPPNKLRDWITVIFSRRLDGIRQLLKPPGSRACSLRVAFSRRTFAHTFLFADAVQKMPKKQAGFTKRRRLRNTLAEQRVFVNYVPLLDEHHPPLLAGKSAPSR